MRTLIQIATKKMNGVVNGDTKGDSGHRNRSRIEWNIKNAHHTKAQHRWHYVGDHGYESRQRRLVQQGHQQENGQNHPDQRIGLIGNQALR